jgi:hypothetical protein
MLKARINLDVVDGAVTTMFRVEGFTPLPAKLPDINENPAKDPQ